MKEIVFKYLPRVLMPQILKVISKYRRESLQFILLLHGVVVSPVCVRVLLPAHTGALHGTAPALHTHRCGTRKTRKACVSEL